MPTKATWQKLQILKSKMADGRHFGIFKSPYLSEKSSDFVEIRCTIANFQPEYSHVTKNWNLKIQDGGGRHLAIRFFSHNSWTDCPILAKFCTKKQNDMPMKATWQKLQILKIQDGGRPPFWKLLNRHLISQFKIVPFWWNLAHYSRYWTRLQSRDQKLQFLKFKILKIAYLAITH